MNDNDRWWTNWAPLWDQIENRHFSTFITDKILDQLKSPILVIGAGQGLIVRYLTKKGYNVTGLDINDTMIQTAKEKYQLDLVKGDATNLPFANNEFQSVIISSGVVDYGAEENIIKKILSEAQRVIKSDGKLFTAFYQIVPSVEKMYRKIGVIDQQGNYRMKRIFEIDRLSKKNPLSCIPSIIRWTNKNIFIVLFQWMILGLTLPKELTEERESIFTIIESGNKLGLDPEKLLNNIPDSLPYRTPDEIKSLFQRLNINFQQIDKYPDCVLVTI
ncbi:MAG: class I SAM-dependent methyltransferase [Spirochaetes bacterium]|nr:class I SAM-dependent methyltransferase [Spirochaetota bacterium]